MTEPIHLQSLPDFIVTDVLESIKDFEVTVDHVFIVYDDEDKPVQWYFSNLNATVHANRIGGYFRTCLIMEVKNV